MIMNFEKNRIKQRILNGEVVTVPVNSSNISTWAYNPVNKVLTILFKRGTTYKYDKVDLKTVLNLLFTESTGKAFRSFIDKRFDYKKIEVTCC